MLLSLGLIISIALLEFIVRALNIAPTIVNSIGCFRLIDNPKLVYEFIPGSQTRDGLINKQGFKDRDFIKKKPEGIVRIAMLGDSVTEGSFVDLGKTFSDRLETLLNQEAAKKKGAIRYEVMNFGVGGYNLEAEVELLKTKVLAYNPDIVVLNFYHNDNEPLPGLYSFFVYDKNNLDERQKELIFKKYFSSHKNSTNYFAIRNILYSSKLYLLLMDRLGALSKAKQELPGFMRQHYCAEIKDNDMDMLKSNFSNIADMKIKNGFKFLVCIHPDLTERENSNDIKIVPVIKLFKFPYFHMKEYYKKTGIPFDLLKVRSNDICHPNELGHLLISKAFFTEFKRNNFIR